MRMLVLAGFVIAGGGSGLIFLSDAPMERLETIAALHVARVHGGRDRSVAATPRAPYDMNVDKVIDLLPLCPSVKEFRMVPMAGKRERLARIVKSPWIISIDLGLTDAVDDDLAALGGMDDLEWLDLTGNVGVTDAGIAHLAKCTTLRTLNLAHTSVTGTTLADLANCRALETLELMACPVTDETVAMIPRFPKIMKINLSETQITEKGLRHFVNWHYLTLLGIPNSIPRDARIEFNRQWRAEYERAKAAGEDVPPKPGRGVYVRE